MLTFKSLSLVRDKKVLLDHAAARIERGYRVGLVGRNGTGKSTLLQCIMGRVQEDDGAIGLDVDFSRIAYLEQALPHSEAKVLDYVKSGDQAWQTVQERLIQAEADEDGLALAECYTTLQDIDGYTIDARAGQILHGLGFSNEAFERPINSFSGGWQMRLQLARVLISRADVLLLDEPTNHLDIDAIVWLEQWLSEHDVTLLVVSHDRDFLDDVCTHILHLSQQRLKLYSGNYTAFTKQYELQLEVEASQRAGLEKKRAHMQKFVDRFRAKASKAKQAQSRVKALEKLTLSPGLQRENPFHFEFFPCEPAADPVVSVRADIGYPDKPILRGVKFILHHGERVGLLGRNGSGKTTLMKTLAGVLDAQQGDITMASKINIAYFSQQQLDALDYEATPLLHLTRLDPRIAESTARKFLGGFAFSGDRVFDKVGSFSGGERARLALALLIYGRPNMLLLDEPTNHLDIQMREALILALQQYEGSVVLVSHDRYFISSVVDRLWWITQGKVEPFTGDLLDYQRAILASEDQIIEEKPQKKAVEKKAVSTSKPVNKSQQKLEAKIAKVTEQVKVLEQQLAEDQLYQPEQAALLAELTAEHHRIFEELKSLEEQWLQALENASD